MTLRRASLAVCMLVLVAVLPSCGGRSGAAANGTRVIVLGVDGMDHALTQRLIDEGRLPSLARLAEQGAFTPLETAVPPLSPVAWSEFITGLDAGGHGIFDFFHRDPETMIPEFSMSRAEESEVSLKLGHWKIPLSGGKVELLRQGQPFWEVLERAGVETTVIRMPANYPPSGTATRELSGMGTPDLLGGYGTFSFYSSRRLREESVSGGKIYPLFPDEGVVRAALYGPDNPFLVEKQKLSLPFTLYLDPQEPAAKLAIGGQELLLLQGEWSGWVPVEFEMIPTQSLRGMCRVYLREVRPEVELYISPINFDPEDPATPISTPDSFAAELAEASGRYYTQGMPEDTQSLRQGVFRPEEFLAQARIAGEEIVAQYGPVLERFERGLLFYYFGNMDQVSHMMWRAMDPEHPAYDPVADAPFRDAVIELYEQADRVVGETLARIDDDTLLIVMSDHGFTSWRRAFSLNTWLKEEGYLTLLNPAMTDDPGFFVNVDWTGTRAYALGFNGLYVNQRGREQHGIVDASQREALMEEIANKLLQVIDPATGEPAVTRVYFRERDFQDRGRLEIGPDLVVGYAKGTRTNDDSALGGVPPEVFEDNREPWSGDHSMDHETVPGVLFANRPLRKPAASLKTLAASILAEFGIEEEFPRRD